MGTLFNQQPRNFYLVDEEKEMEFVISLSNKFKISISETIQILEYLEKRRTNNLMAADCDIKDEQLAGFGELIKQFNTNIERIADYFSNSEVDDDREY